MPELDTALIAAYRSGDPAALRRLVELAALYPRDVRVVLKNFPMPGHKQAHLAAQAALAAGGQGKYWETRDLLLANQDDLGRAALETYAQKLDLDLARFRRALDEKRFAAQVDRDVEETKAAGLTGVPVSKSSPARASSA